MKNTAKALLIVAVGALMLASQAIVPASAGHDRVVVVTKPVDIRVWLESSPVYDDPYYDDDYYDDYDEYDVYPSADDVVLCVRASRSTYATVYVVDTEGFIHVVYPLSIRDDAFLRGGRVYKFRLADIGLYDYAFGTGVAFAYAVSSPVPFRYHRYGVGIFGAGFGFRIYGDPYIASRRFYVDLVAGACDLRLIGISHARFYVRAYVRYPSYLCAGWHDVYGVHSYCRGDCFAFRSYRVHAKDPYRILHPKYKVKYKSDRYTKIAPVDAKSYKKHLKAVKKRVRHHDEVVVRSSKDSFLKGKKHVSDMREQLKRRDTLERHREFERVGDAKSRKSAAKKTSKVTAHKKKTSKVTAHKKKSKAAEKATKVTKKERTTQAKKSSKGKAASDDKKSSKKVKRGAR